MSTQETEVDINSTFNNDHLTVNVTRQPHCQIKFDIKVNPSATVAAYHKALKAINKEVTIPGFRKGRAPDQLIIDKFHSSIQKEFIDIVLQTGFNEAIQLTHIHPLKDGQIQRPVIHECSREKGAHFVIVFESRPTIPSIQLEDLKLHKVSPVSVTEKERQNALQQVLLQFTTYEPIEERPVEENDFVDVDVSILEEPPREVIHNQRAQVNKSGLPSWIRQKVIGLRAGESAEGMTEQDPDLTTPTPDFRPLPFRVIVNAIWKGNVPPVDQELAQRVGLQSIEELYQKINERLEHEVQEDAYRQQIVALEQLLISKYPFDLPQSYIDANKQARLDDYLRQLEEQQSTYNEEEHEKIEKMIEQSTIQHLQLFFLLRRVAADHHLKVTQEEISQELARQVALLPSGRSPLDLSSDQEKLREQLHNLAFDRKIKQFLIDHATFDE